MSDLAAGSSTRSLATPAWIRAVAGRLALPVVLLGAIEAWVRIASPSPLLALPPSSWLSGLGEVLADSEFWGSLAVTSSEVAAAMLIGGLVGIGMGLLMHRVRLLRAAWQPYLVALYANPIIVLYPVAALIIGLGPKSIIAISAPLVVPPIAMSVLLGLGTVRPAVLELGRSLVLNPWQRSRLHLQAAAPTIFGGVNVALVYAVIGVVSAEFLLSSSGLGYEVRLAYQEFQTQRMYTLILIIMLLSAFVGLANAALERVIRRDLGGERA